MAAAVDGKHTALGFSGSSYSNSKSCATHYMRVLDAAEAAETRSIRCVAVCPGLCRTGMAGGQIKNPVSAIFYLVSWIIGTSARAGADTPAYMALCDGAEFERKFAGRFVRDRVVRSF